MGIISEVQKIKKEYKQAKMETEKATKKVKELTKKLEVAKEEKQNKREYERDLKKAVKDDLITTFQRCFDRDGLRKGYLNLSLKATRDEILENVPENDLEGHYVDDNYERILNKVKKIYENDQKAKEELQKIELQKQLTTALDQQRIQQEKKKKEEKKLDIFYLLTNLFFWIFNPISIIILLILGYFVFAEPLFEKEKDSGYDKFDTVYIDENTGKEIPKNQVYNYLKGRSQNK